MRQPRSSHRLLAATATTDLALGLALATASPAAADKPAAGHCARVDKVKVKGAETIKVACLDDLTTAGTLVSGHTNRADWNGPNAPATTNPTGVPGIQIDGYSPTPARRTPTTGGSTTASSCCAAVWMAVLLLWPLDASNTVADLRLRLFRSARRQPQQRHHVRWRLPGDRRARHAVGRPQTWPSRGQVRWPEPRAQRCRRPCSSTASPPRPWPRRPRTGRPTSSSWGRCTTAPSPRTPAGHAGRGGHEEGHLRRADRASGRPGGRARGARGRVALVALGPSAQAVTTSSMRLRVFSMLRRVRSVNVARTT